LKNTNETSGIFNYDLIVYSPGRINLIGEHIDYNGGNVLPAAIDKKITLKFKKNTSDKQCLIKSLELDSGFNINLDEIKKSNLTWENYILGVLYEINLLRPEKVKGFDCEIESNLPVGSGISSSAALECGFAKGINQLFDLELTDLEIITLARNAEHNFVGTKCGIMDQFAVVKGKQNHFIHLNCDTLDYEYIKADFEPYTILLLNTNISHNLATSEYNKRREECATALQIINKQTENEVSSLTEIQEGFMLQNKDAFPETIYKRAMYVIQENKRVQNTVDAVKKSKNIREIGDLLYQSHEGLQHLYEVSCAELDFLVNYSKQFDYILGSRMMGGGFGGCTINIIHKKNVNEYIEKVSKAYYNEFSIDLTPILINIGNGVKIG